MKQRGTDTDTGTWSFLKLIDSCLPPSLRDNAAMSLNELIRARVLTGLLISGSGLIASMIVVIALCWLIIGEDFLILMLLTVTMLVLVLLNALFFYQTGRVNSAAVLYSLSVFIVCVIAIIMTGGFTSPAMPILICLPVLAFLIGGRHEGVYNAVLIYVTATTLLILNAYEFPMMQLMEPPVQPYMAGIAWFATIAVIVICLYVYDVLLEQAGSTIAYVDSDASS